MGELLNRDQVMALIQAQYPELVPILQKPGVWDAISVAVQNNYTPSRLQAALQATEYYRTTAASDRSWDILSTVDPATAAVQSKTYWDKMWAMSSQVGISPNTNPTLATQIFHEAIVNHWSDQEFRLNFVSRMEAGATGKPAGGELATMANQVHSMAADYGVQLSDQAALDWASKLTAGQVDQNGVKGYLIEQAKSMYPSLSGAIDAGFTVRQYADPYAQIAARELNINPDDFQLSDPKWASALQQTDPKTGQRMAMSLDQWQTKLRTDPQYGFDQTQGAKAQAANLQQQLGQMMGVIG